MTTDGWLPDYGDASEFLHLLDGRTIHANNNTDLAYFADDAFNARLDAADALTGTERTAALAALDADTMRTSAPWAPLATLNWVDFVSQLTACQVVNPRYGLDLAVLCERTAAAPVGVSPPQVSGSPRASAPTAIRYRFQR